MHAGALLTLAALPACHSRTDPLGVASHIWPGYAFLTIARDQGALSPRIRLVEVPSAGESLHALAAGLVDAATLTLDEVLRARAGGVPLTVVLVFNVSAGADVLLVREKIRTLGGLRGLRIGAERSATGAVMLAEALQLAGLTPADVQLVEVSVARQEAAWDNGDVDAVISYDPVAKRIEKRGGKRLFDSGAIPDTIFDVLAVRSSVLETQADAIRQLVRAHFSALDALDAPHSDSWQRVARYLQLTEAQARASLAQLALPKRAHNHTLLAPDGKLQQQARRLAQLMQDNRLLATAPPLDGLVSAAYLDGGTAS